MWSDDDKGFEAFNLKRSQMMELCMPGDILGYITKEAAAVTGIPEGIPVVATANDKAVEALGTGLMLGNLGLISLGTYSTGMMPVDRLMLDNPQEFWPNYGCIPLRYLLETRKGIHRGMWTVSWLSDLLSGGIADEAARRGVSVLQLLNEEAAQVPAGSHGLITVPEWLVMVANQPFKKGMMIGFDVRHGRAHMFRSLLEGIILKLHNSFTDMCNEVSIFPDRLIASGGGSKGDVFVQIIADVFGLPVTRNEIEDAAGTGSAICAAVATGIYPDFDSAAREMVRVKDTFQPDMENHTLYKRLNDEVFRDLTKATDPILEKTYEIFG
jgi:sugar (pentulose or hexulose) kinase